jgi:hypothetical protein
MIVRTKKGRTNVTTKVKMIVRTEVKRIVRTKKVRTNVWAAARSCD